MASLIPLALAAAVYRPLLAGIIVLLARDKPVAMHEGTPWAAFAAGLIVKKDGGIWAAALIGVYLTIKGVVNVV